MAVLELNVIGEWPEGLDLEPMQRVFSALVSAENDAPDGQINLAFVDDEEIRSMNRDHAGHDYATDVLSFSYIEDGEAIGEVLGEMVISLETAERQAEEAGTSLAEEVALLALHGTLHILGYDHQTEVERQAMQTRQRELMTAAGYQYREFRWIEA